MYAPEIEVRRGSDIMQQTIPIMSTPMQVVEKMARLVTAQTVSAANQWDAVSPDVWCLRCGRNFVLGVLEETWADRWLGRLRVVSFRCQVCNARFRKRSAEPPHGRGLGRRQYFRLPVQLPALIQLHDGTTSTARIKDLSIDGCELVCERALEQGVRLTVQISRLLTGRKIDAAAAVVHTSLPQKTGLKFTRMAKLKQEELGRALYLAWNAGRHLRLSSSARPWSA